MFTKGNIVVAKNEYIRKGETLQETAGLVLDYNPDNDYLHLGVLHPEEYAIAPTFSMRGSCYRLLKESEAQKWGIK